MRFQATLVGEHNPFPLHHTSAALLSSVLRVRRSPRCCERVALANELKGVLKDAQYIYDNAIDVSIDMYGTKGAAASIYKAMQERSYSTDAWSQHELHPKPSEGFSDVDIVNFIFTMDLLNFSYALITATTAVLTSTDGRSGSGPNSIRPNDTKSITETNAGQATTA